MIVVNKKPNITHMPHHLGKQPGVFSFIPGKNEIDPKIWAAVKKEAGDERMDAHYNAFLRPIGEDESEQLDDPSKLNADDFIDLIKGTMSLDTLQDYAAAEDARKGSPRKTVIAAITEQAEEIKKIEAKKQENEQ
jgi:hypothetical protein